jgi:type 1 glutamine amidotransferase
MQQRALIVQGGWDGHEPRQVAEIFAAMLRAEGFAVEVSDTLDAFRKPDLADLDLIVPVWTMAEIAREQLDPVIEAVADGTGIAGCHGGMCDAFRTATDWQFMTGGNWVAHPGNDGQRYAVEFRRGSSPLVEGLENFEVTTEQYYLHVDPAVEVLATTRFPTATWYHAANGPVDMPVIWTKRWGAGRVFYCSLGHHADIFRMPTPAEIMRRGFRWAAEGKRLAREQGLSAKRYRRENAAP